MGIFKKRGPCLKCGKELKRGQKMFCSVTCSNKSREGIFHRVNEYVCKNCGKSFRPKAADRTSYCSRKCAYTDRNNWCYFIKKDKGKTKEKEFKRKNKLILRKCVICNGSIPEAERLSVVYCSDKCRKKKARDDYYANHNRALELAMIRDSKNRIPYHEIECGECGKKFMQEYKNVRSQYCSDICMRRSVRRNSKHRRKVRLKTAFVERVYWSRIYKRDKGICQICGKKVKDNKKVPHPYSPSLDHIVPLARGGTHEPKNVRLSHFICNSIKRDGVSDNGDQLLLFG